VCQKSNTPRSGTYICHCTYTDISLPNFLAKFQEEHMVEKPDSKKKAQKKAKQN